MTGKLCDTPLMPLSRSEPLLLVVGSASGTMRFSWYGREAPRWAHDGPPGSVVVVVPPPPGVVVVVVHTSLLCRHLRMIFALHAGLIFVLPFFSVLVHCPVIMSPHQAKQVARATSGVLAWTACAPRARVRVRAQRASRNRAVMNALPFVGVDGLSVVEMVPFAVSACEVRGKSLIRALLRRRAPSAPEC